VGRRLPQLDLQQDWMLTYFREENNVTTLRFYRQRDTNDSANDTVIQVTKKAFVPFNRRLPYFSFGIIVFHLV